MLDTNGKVISDYPALPDGGLLLNSPRHGLFVGSSEPGMILAKTPPAGVNKLHDLTMEGFRGTGVTVNA